MDASPPLTVFAALESSLARGRATKSFSERLCAQTRAHLHEFVDNELDLRDVSERALHDSANRHLLLCTKCARLESQLRAMRLALAAVGARTMHRERASESLHTAAVGMLRAYIPSASSEKPHGLRLVD